MKLIAKKTLKDLLRYLLLFFTVFIATQFIQECNIGMKTSILIALITVLIYVVLDIFLPLIINDNKTQRKLIRFLLIFFTVFIGTRFIIHECYINYSTSFIISTMAVIMFSLLDMYFPKIVVNE